MLEWFLNNLFFEDFNLEFDVFNGINKITFYNFDKFFSIHVLKK